jgi:hypothetical protein
MKRYLEANPSNPILDDEISRELFEDDKSHVEAPLSVTAPHRAYPEIGPHFAVDPLGQARNRLDLPEKTSQVNERPASDRFEPRFTPIVSKGPRALPTAVKVIGALIAIALIGFAAFGGWSFGPGSQLGDENETHGGGQTEKANKGE